MLGTFGRVAGAAWLAGRGVPTPVIQLLGRWSSTAVVGVGTGGPGEGCSARSPPRTSSPVSGQRRHRPRPAPRHGPFWMGGPARNSPRAGGHRRTMPSALCSPLHPHRREARRTKRITIFLTPGARRLHATDLAEATTEKFCGRPGPIRHPVLLPGHPGAGGGVPGAFGKTSRPA